MATDPERALNRQLRAMKERMKQMEAVFEAQDEESNQRINELTTQQKALMQKVRDTEKMCNDLSDEKADLIRQLEALPQSTISKTSNVPLSAQPASGLSDSMVQEYDELRDRNDALEAERSRLQALLEECESKVQMEIELNEELERACADQKEQIQMLSKAIKEFQQDLQERGEIVKALLNQLDHLSEAKVGNGVTLEDEIAAHCKENEQEAQLRTKADDYDKVVAELQVKDQELADKEKKINELVQEAVVHRRAVTAKKEEENKKDVELLYLRGSLKDLGDKTKRLQKELDDKLDLVAENTAIKHHNATLSEENERLKKEVNRLKKMYGCAEARADENEYILQKVTARAPPVINPLDGTLPNQSMFGHQLSAFSTPNPKNRAASTSRIIRSSSTVAKREPSLSSNASNIPASMIQTPLVPRKRGIMLDLTEPVNRERLDFKVHALSEKNKRRRVEHLNSHYDPSLGIYDESFGESPTKAAAISKATPKKDSFFQSILRRKNSL